MLIGAVIFQSLILIGALILLKLYRLKIKQLRKRIRKIRRINPYMNCKVCSSTYKTSFNLKEDPVVSSLENNVWAVLNDKKVLGRFSNNLEAETHLMESKRNGIAKVYIAFDPDFKYGSS